MGVRTLGVLAVFGLLLTASASRSVIDGDSAEEALNGPTATIGSSAEPITTTAAPTTTTAPSTTEEPGSTTTTKPDDLDEDAPDRDTEDEDAPDRDTEDEDPDETADTDQDEVGSEGTTSPIVTGPGTGPFVALNPVGPDDAGDDVEALQHRLAELGFAPGTPDGDYGGRTVRAVEAFQFLMDLEVTGEADIETVSALTTYRYNGLLLYEGDESAEVEALQKKLASGPFDPGTPDGKYGTGTKQAVWALEKLAGFPVDGNWGPLDAKAWEMLMDGEIGGPENSHDQRWVEVDLTKQIMKVYDPGSTTPVLISHASSGSGVPWKNEDHSGSSVTPLGDFHINRRINGWRESSLNIGRLYNPLYFNGGIAFHGAQSVPLYPASHGCIRLPMHVADYLPGELPNGTPVHILRSA